MRKIVLGVTMLTLAACGGKDGPTIPSVNQVSAVTVSSPGTSVTVGGTLQLNATALNTSGQAIAGKIITWQSLSPNIATVTSPGGLVTGVAPGSAVIRATADNKIGETTVLVDVDRCTNPLTLAVGEVRTLSGPSAVACVTLAATTGPSDFLFITANANPVPDDSREYTVVGNLLAEAITATAAVQQAFDPRTELEFRAAEFEDAFETRLRASERDLVTRVRPAVRMRGQLSLSAADAASARAALVVVGDTVPLNVPNANSGALCTNFTGIRAVVRAVGSKALVVEDVASPTGGFTSADFIEIAREFDDLIYPTDTTWFGVPSDIDRDGKVVILYTPEVNKLTPAGSSGFVGGFFWGGDLFTKAQFQAENINCPATNEREIFYVLTPDPTGTINNNSRSTTSVRQGTRGTIAHEFQHMINQGIRQFDNAVDSLETAWLNEALSHFAEEVTGRAIRNFGDSQSLSFADVNPNPAAMEDYRAFFQQNFLRFRSWMQRPDTSSPTSRKAASQLAPRGAAWAILRYAADHYSNGNPKNFTRRMVAGPKINVQNFTLTANASFEEILNGWLVANYTDNLTIPGLAPRYQYLSYNMRDIMSSVFNGTFPLLVNPLPQAAPVNTKSLSGSGNYFRLTRAAAAPQPYTFRMQSTGGGNVDFASSRVYILRLQ